MKNVKSQHPIAFLEMFSPFGVGVEQQRKDGDLAYS
jgi:hypothetical protein